MGTWPVPVVEPLVTIYPWSLEAIGTDLVAQGGALNASASAGWPSANGALLFPFTLTKQIIVLEVFVYNGATISGSFDVGVYSADGNKVFSSGAVAQSTASVIQSASVSTNIFHTCIVS